MVFLIILINNQAGNNTPHKYKGIIVNSLKTPINIVSISFKYKKSIISLLRIFLPELTEEYMPRI